jgi:cytosine/adenosine deaminase-related metal-dependent hydrolase
MVQPRILHARLLLTETGVLVPGGGLLVRGGRIERVLAGARAIARAREPGLACLDLGEGLLAPGLVDAHAHLELSALRGKIGSSGGFVGWIRELVAARRACEAHELAAAASLALDSLVRSGTTCVGDVDSLGTGERALERHAIRARLYRELLDGDDAARTPAALEWIRRPSRTRPGLSLGISPHSPYTVSDAAMKAAAAPLRGRRRAIAIHWSETREELEWMLEGRGPLALLLERSPARSGLDRIERAGLLTARTALIHGNHPLPGEIERIAASGVTLVHCPGSHRFFGREPFAVDTWLASGVPIALGTDSLASNEELDMRREMALLRESASGLEPRCVWRAATEGGARALGWANELGRLAPGCRADFALFAVRGGDEASVLDELTAGMPPVLGTWVAGQRIFSPASAGSPEDSGGAAACLQS